LPVRGEFADQKPYGAPVFEVPVRLNVNENPYSPPPEVLDAICRGVAEVAGRLNRYPDRDFVDLRGALAGYLGREADAPWLSAQNLWAANGSNEVITQVLQVFGGPGRSVLSFGPTYSMYPEYARNTHTRLVELPRRPDFSVDLPGALDAIVHHRPSVVFLASPNNPTGTPVDLATVAALAEATGPAGGESQDGPSAVIVVDEAYAEFRRPGTPSAVSLLPRYPHLAVVRTMSKAFAFAGARVGYLAAAPELVDALRVVRLPYHLSALTQAAASAALAHAGALLAGVDRLRRDRDLLVAALEARTDPATGRDLQVAPTDANFALFGVFPDRHAVWQGLLDRGVLIRETGPAGWLRVSAGTPAENAAFLAGLDEVLARPPARQTACRVPPYAAPPGPDPLLPWEALK
jgi:histidinol-phosphate aminotransferase